jgi:hypoxanthine phosphoribosyltransferase
MLSYPRKEYTIFSYSEMHSLIQKNLFSIPEDIDLVVGIPRSGLLPASHIAASLNLPLQTLNDVVRKFSTKNLFTIRAIDNTENPQHVLLVDDTSNSGLRMRQGLKIINERWNQTKVTTLVMCSATNSAFQPDLAFSGSQVPRIFAWNMFNHDEMTSRIAVDLDGILCVDPTKYENDDGELYINFLNNAKLKIRPTRRVGAIITGRLEKYRGETEDWLSRNSIDYSELFMNDAKSAKYRREKRFTKNGSSIDQISEFKARILASLNPPLFVESNYQQAFNIHKTIGVNTYSFDDDIYFGSSNFF